MNQGHPIQSHALMGEMESVNCEFWRDEAKNEVHELSHPPTQESNQLVLCHNAWQCKGCLERPLAGGNHHQTVAYSDLHI